MKNSSIYREALLNHFRNPKNIGFLDKPDLIASASNPICGDELELSIALCDNKIQDCKTRVRGCSICLVSASMMTELIKLKTLNDAKNIRKDFLECLKKDNFKIPDYLEDLSPLISLKKQRSRIKCMSLAWDALQNCIRQKEK